MAFDLATAQPVAGGFDLSTAQPVAPAPEQPPAGFSLSKMIENIPASTGLAALNLATPALHPVDTLKSLGNLALGAAEKLIPGQHDKEIYADRALQALKSRYGSMNNAQATLQRDPVGTVVDAASALMGGGAALGKLAPEAAGLSRLGAAMEPLNLATNPVKAVAGAITPASLPRALYERSAKWRPSLPADQRANLTETALREGLMPTTSGVGKQQLVMNEVKGQIDGLIQTADQATAPIPVQFVLSDLHSLRDKLGGFKIDAPADLNTLDKTIQDFTDYLQRTNKTTVTPSELQSFKEDAYKHMKFDLQQGDASYAKNETRGVLARNAKEVLEAVSPEIGPLNERLGNLLQLKPELERAAGRIGNRDAIGIMTPLDIGSGAAIGGLPGALAGGGAALGGRPKLSAAAALALERLRQQGLAKTLMNNSQAGAAMRLGAIQAGRLEDLPTSNR